MRPGGHASLLLVLVFESVHPEGVIRDYIGMVCAAGRSSFLNTRALRSSQIFHMMVRTIEVHCDAGINEMLGCCQMSQECLNLRLQICSLPHCIGGRAVKEKDAAGLQFRQVNVDRKVSR
jgi:hypothetical protein